MAGIENVVDSRLFLSMVTLEVSVENVDESMVDDSFVALGVSAENVDETRVDDSFVTLEVSVENVDESRVDDSFATLEVSYSVGSALILSGCSLNFFIYLSKMFTSLEPSFACQNNYREQCPVM